MGEYATRRSDGERIKIGTCESMYYLRADQVDDIVPERGNVDPAGEHREALLYRFPFPDEDHLQPGEFESHDRGMRIDCPQPEGVTHGTVQLKASNGYLVSLPCPEAGEHVTTDGLSGMRNTHRVVQVNGDGLRVNLNGYGGSCTLVMQRYWEGKLVPVVRCNGCGQLYRMPERADALPMLEYIERQAGFRMRDFERSKDRPGPVCDGDRIQAERLLEIGRRILAGYDLPALA